MVEEPTEQRRREIALDLGELGVNTAELTLDVLELEVRSRWSPPSRPWAPAPAADGTTPGSRTGREARPGRDACTLLPGTDRRSTANGTDRTDR